jgi:hypothetical protein
MHGSAFTAGYVRTAFTSDAWLACSPGCRRVPSARPSTAGAAPRSKRFRSRAG